MPIQQHRWRLLVIATNDCPHIFQSSAGDESILFSQLQRRCQSSQHTHHRRLNPFTPIHGWASLFRSLHQHDKREKLCRVWSVSRHPRRSRVITTCDDANVCCQQRMDGYLETRSMSSPFLRNRCRLRAYFSCACTVLSLDKAPCSAA